MAGRRNNSVSGEYIYNSNSVKQSYRITGGENLKYCQYLYVAPAKDSYDHFRFGGNSELIYESAMSGLNISRLNFSVFCYPNCNNLSYCISCSMSSHLFACIGLRKKQHCILNKQYTKEEYEELVPRIIAHMNSMPHVDSKGREYRYGEFFPPELSPFTYNETIAQEYFPLTKEQALSQGYRWREAEQRNYQITMKTGEIPDHIKDVPDSITNEVIACAHNQECNEQCAQAFKVILQELAFYRRMNIPLPRLCPNCRHYARLKQRNPLRLWERQCQCAGVVSSNNAYRNTADHPHGASPCSNIFQASYALGRPEIVYCGECYNVEVA